MGDKLPFVYYTAGAIEADSKSGMTGWRNELKERLKPAVQYDPVEREVQKTQRPTGEHVKYVAGLKQAGHYDIFLKEMDKIWFGSIKPEGHVPDVFFFLRNRKLVDGNEERDLNYWADYEAVLRSEFLVAYIKKDVPTTGTIGEIFLAYMFRIPVFLIIDQPKTDCNSTLLYWTLRSGGDVFYTLNDVVKAVKEKYNLK